MMTTEQIADLRIIQRVELGQTKGQIVVGNGRIFALSYDSLIDLIHALEVINAKLTLKWLSLKVVPKLYNPQALSGARIKGGGADLYDGRDGEPVQRFGHWCRVEINGNVYDSWFTRLDELIKCLYAVVKDEQKDPFARQIMEGVGV